CMQTLDFPWTF
nr:immunoglobulin light chain junction region [Macaca mulatta]MOW62129.1 immunoglobulin light chain junction region [Macaca mulatta]MOW64717.1 immunoglobulin light chain junction region [Macaca mulatta]MOW65924.1 immunoglobulin light chain junction region [Macaca mulatta]MOX27187.1 immunoglobulin light chain junction region [Macaca mulatta]